MAVSGLRTAIQYKSGYWQIEMDPVDRVKAAFTSGIGLWQFTVLENNDGAAQKKQIVVPSSKIPEVLCYVHDRSWRRSLGCSKVCAESVRAILLD